VRARRATDAAAAVAALAAVVLAALAACGPGTAPSCSWYTPVTAGGAYAGQVIVVASGPACTSPALAQWIADRTGRAWSTTSLAADGTELAGLTRAGSALEVWFTGPASGPAGPVAGGLADGLEADGWTPVVP
jgi:hypothetical protein